ncbi:Williams-Beuren syndrome chromosomal region 27 [Lecanosticta acicola]|uniref:Williams-Beuren syndrome chromosomal region 27 n=1 Tax=Lecanosticta acicola TaxID=111012 RepID=A0AAI8YYF5_9PEZI|nr:Williams-Beuren syndrome chromosomal region 27 [Lecanosticta acicola]
MPDLSSTATGTAGDFLQRAYALDGAADSEQLYKEWASLYDTHLGEMQYASPQRAVEALLQHLDSKSQEALTVLDAGCGTGLVGECLQRSSFPGKFMIDGLDITPGMLQVARNKALYRDLEVADLTKPINRSDGSYGAVLCVGTLTKGHVGPAVLREFARVLRIGGLIVATIHDEIWESGGYKSTVTDLGRSGAVEIVSTAAFGMLNDSSEAGRMVVLKKRS